MLLSKQYVIPEGVAQILNHPKANDCHNITDFWICMAALKEFITKNSGLLPINGAVVDMVSNTNNFIGLQTLYQKKAESDLATYTTIVSEICKQRNTPMISKEYVEKICKNSNSLSIINYRKITEEDIKCKESTIADGSQDSNVILYVLLRAINIYLKSHDGKYPGREKYLEDFDEFVVCVKKACTITAFPFDCIPTTMIKEMLRMSNFPLQTTAALLGGVASQEIIKLLSGKFSPSSNTVIYNAITSTVATLEF